MSHRTRTTAIAAAAALLLAAASVATVSHAASKPVITMSGSTSVYPLAVKLATAYNKAYPKRASFKILQGSSDIGVNDVAKGRVTIGNVSRDPIRGSDPGGLTFNKIARDGICVITHSSNAIAQFSQAQIQAIFAGRTRAWSDIPGAKVSGPIDLVTRTAASGTGDAFQNIFMGPSLRVAANAAAKQSNGLVRQTVASNRNAIGFVSLDFISGVNVVGYRGVACNLRNAKSGQYGGVRNFWMVTRGAAKGPAGTFLRWVKSNPVAKRQVATNWIPLR
ncbi:MAG: substrate-binding domain-containing protein [Solirubrobacterales bacterium]|nr:substrate-binding domain-containing protein [Solirubrobacterales bacterium]